MSDDIYPAGSIPINIRSPNSSFQDLRLNCPGTLNISALKEQISQRLDNKLHPKKQRLVYAGKILENKDLLNDVIRFQDECSVYTILLVSSEPPKVVKSKPDSESRRNLRSEIRTNIQSGTSMQGMPANGEPIAPTPPVTGHLPPVNGGHLDLPAVGHLELNSWASQYIQLSNQIQSATDHHTSQQMAAIQEMYSQYLMQYIQYIQTSSQQYMQTSSEQYIQQNNDTIQAYFQNIAPTSISVSEGVMTPPRNPTVEEGLRYRANANVNRVETDERVNDGVGPGGQEVPDQNQRQAVGVIANPLGARVPAAAAGGQPQRDMLDWVYSSVRILFLVSLVYFYSSLPRFLLVLGIFLAFQYFQREGNQQQQERLNIQQHVNNIRDNNIIQQQDVQEQVETVEATPAQQTETEETVADTNNEHQDDTDNQQNQDTPPDTLTMISTFILSFFTSLLPEPTNQIID